MKTRSIFALLLVSIALPLFAQNPIASSKSTDIQVKIRQVDLMNQILPVLFTKTELKAILPSVEKARQAESALLKLEEKALRDLEADLDSGLKNGTEKQQVAPAELMTKILNAFKGMQIARQMLATEQVEAVTDAVDKALDSGQKKAATSALDIAYFHGKDPKTMTDREKLKIYVGSILLDPLAYDVLMKLYKALPN